MNNKQKDAADNRRIFNTVQRYECSTGQVVRWAEVSPGRAVTCVYSTESRRCPALEQALAALGVNGAYRRKLPLSQKERKERSASPKQRKDAQPKRQTPKRQTVDVKITIAAILGKNGGDCE